MKNKLFTWIFLCLFSVSCVAQKKEVVVGEIKDGKIVENVSIPVNTTPDNSLLNNDLIMIDGLTRIMDTDNTGNYSFRQDGTELMRIGGNNDQAVRIKGIEAFPGSPIINLLSGLSYDNATSGLTSTDLKSAIDELADRPIGGSLSTDNQNRITNENDIKERELPTETPTIAGVEASASGDEGLKILNIVTGTNQRIVTLPASTDIEIGQTLDYNVASLGSQIEIIPETERVLVCIDGVSEGANVAEYTSHTVHNSIRATDFGSNVSVTKLSVPAEFATDFDHYYNISGNWNTSFATTFTPPVVYTDANSSNLNESLGIGNWIVQDADLTLSRATDFVHDGIESIAIDYDGNAGSDQTYTETALTGVSNGDNVTVTGWYYAANGNGSIGLYVAGGWDVQDRDFNTTYNTWIPFSQTANATQDNPTLRFYSSGANNNYSHRIDGVEVTIN